MLHSTAQVRAIRERLPNCRLTILTSTTAYDIYRENPHVDRIILFDRYRIKRDWWKHLSWSIKHIVEVMREVRLEAYDVALDLQGSWKTIIFLWGSRATKRFVKGRWWFASRFHCPELHALDEMNGVLRLAGLGEGGKKIELFTSVVDQASVHRKIVLHNLEGRRWILCSPISRWVTKDWPLKNYVDLAAILPDDIVLVFSGSMKDKEPIRLAMRSLSSHRVVNLAGDLSVAELSALSEKAQAVLTVDSFALHVAAANGRPTVALFAPTDEGKVGPISDSTTIIRPKRVNCTRCYRRTYCPKQCITTIAPQEICRALQTVASGFL